MASINHNWETYAWAIWLVLFFILEAIGLWKRSINEGMTLTYFIENHFPRWFLAGLLGWLTYHFLSSSPAKG